MTFCLIKDRERRPIQPLLKAVENTSSFSSQRKPSLSVTHFEAFEVQLAEESLIPIAAGLPEDDFRPVAIIRAALIRRLLRKRANPARAVLAVSRSAKTSGVEAETKVEVDFLFQETAVPPSSFEERSARTWIRDT